MNEQASAAIIANLNKAGILSSEYTFIASDSWATGETITYGTANFAGSFTGELVKGTIGIIQQPGDLSWFSPCYGALNPTNNNYPLFLAFWQQRFRCQIGSGLGTCPGVIESRSLETPCNCIGNETLAGDSANSKNALVYDSVVAVANALDTILNNCTAITSRDVCTPTNFTSEDLLVAMRELSFSGKSGLIKFDGVDRTTSNFFYLQYDGSSWQTVGSYDESTNAATFDTPLTWRTAGNTTPFSQIIPDVLSYGSGMAIVVMSISAISIIIAFISMVLFWRNREKPVIKRSSPIFCNMILGGLILIWISLFMWAGNQTDILCNSKLWLGAIGYAIVMGALLAKNYRIWRIFDNDKLRSRVITNRELLYFSAVIVGIEMLLMGILMIDRPTPKILISGSSTLYHYQACQTNNTLFQKVMTGVLFAYNGLLVFIGSLLAFKTRKVVSSFNESKFIAVSMYNMLISGVVLAPIYFTTGDSRGVASRLYIIRSLACLFATVITMTALFGPKIRQLLNNSGKEDHTTNRTTDSDGNRVTKMLTSTRPNVTLKSAVKMPASLNE